MGVNSTAKEGPKLDVLSLKLPEPAPPSSRIAAGSDSSSDCPKAGQIRQSNAAANNVGVLASKSKLGPDSKPAHCIDYPTLLQLVIMQRFPEANPDVEQPKAGADTPKEAARNQGAEGGERQQEVVVGPLGSPRKDDQENARHGADQHEKKNRNAVHPELDVVWFRIRLGRRGRFGRACLRIESVVPTLPARGSILSLGLAGNGCGIGHSHAPRQWDA